MPELPEVETIRLGLQKHLVGHTIERVEVLLPKMVQGDIAHLKGAKVLDVKREGKGLIINVSNNYSIAIHIKLTGQLIYTGKTTPKQVKVIKGTYSTLPNKWTHVIFHLDHDEKLFYNDFRKFGWIKIVKTDEVENLPFFKELGPEFFKDLDEKTFATIIKNSKTVIKPLIMDQKKMGGIGNIYANDSLNLAKIDPHRKADSLTEEEIKRLFNALIMVLKRGLEYGGASELSYVNALGGEGKYQEHFLTYARSGEKCFNCGGIIEKTVIAGRGTYYCPKCQK